MQLTLQEWTAENVVPAEPVVVDISDAIEELRKSASDYALKEFGIKSLVWVHSGDNPQFEEAKVGEKLLLVISRVQPT